MLTDFGDVHRVDIKKMGDIEKKKENGTQTSTLCYVYPSTGTKMCIFFKLTVCLKPHQNLMGAYEANVHMKRRNGSYSE